MARGPLGVRIEWDAEVINDIPPTLLSWKSIGDSDVVSAGSVRFKPVGEHGTEVRVKLQYDPPEGKLGRSLHQCLARILSIRSPRTCAASSNCWKAEKHMMRRDSIRRGRWETSDR